MLQEPSEPPREIIRAVETLKAESHCSVCCLLAFGSQTTL